jgi:hypothetical protein
VDRGLVQVFGYERTGTVSVPITSYLVPVRPGGSPIVVGGDSGGLSVIDPTTDGVTHYPGVGLLDQSRFQGLRGAGTSYDGSRILVSSSDSSDSLVERWHLLPLPVLIDTAIQTRARLVSEIGPGKFLLGANHNVDLIGFGAPVSHTVQNADRTYLSPAGDRVTVRGAAPDLPVFDTQTGAIVFTVDGLVQLRDAAFTADGQLYVVGWIQDGTSQLRVYSSATGDSLGQVTVPEEVVSLVVDPVRSLVYLGTFTADINGSNATVTLRVYRRSDLSIAGTMSVRVADICRFATVCYGDVALLETGSYQEVVLLLNKYVTTDLLHFRLPPLGP